VKTEEGYYKELYQFWAGLFFSMCQKYVLNSDLLMCDTSNQMTKNLHTYVKLCHIIFDQSEYSEV